MGLAADTLGPAVSYGPKVLNFFGQAKAAESLAAAETPIIDAGLMALSLMSNSCGFGTPDEGQGFGLGSDAFEKIENVLATTDAPDSWAGNGSEAYTGQNGWQHERAEKMRTIDRDLQHVLEREASQLNDTRQVIDYMTTALSFWILPAIDAYAIEFPPGAGVALSMEIQTAAVAMTVPIATARFQQMTFEAAANAAEVSRIAAQYDEIGMERGAPESSGCGWVSVATSDLENLSSQLDQVAEQAETAGQTTEDTGRNVLVSHGLVCAGTSAAVGSAVGSRIGAANGIGLISNHLGIQLRGAVGEYDQTDICQGQGLDGQVQGR